MKINSYFYSIFLLVNTSFPEHIIFGGTNLVLNNDTWIRKRFCVLTPNYVCSVSNARKILSNIIMNPIYPILHSLCISDSTSNI